MQNWGVILLGVWLIAAGLTSLLGVRFSGGETLLSFLAIAAGALLLIGARKIKLRAGLGLILLSVWLILTGLLPFINLSFPGLEVALAILAIAAGVLLLLKR
jgi:hypothetical protein